MDVEALRRSPLGELVRIRGTDACDATEYDHFAFVPMPLPSTVHLTQETWTSAAEAMQSLGALSQACHQLPNPRLLIAPALVREALTTSALEGTYGTLPDVLEARLPQFDPATPEVREIVAYQRMAELAFTWVEDRPITIGMLTDLQRILADASHAPVRDPGQIRTHQVVIGPQGSSVYEARFVPVPPGDQLRAGLEDWERWVNADHRLAAPVATAMAHYQFEALHPFGDCNGRVGRLVVILQLLRNRTLVAPYLTLSPWLLRHRVAYQDHLLAISTTGDWNPWVQFFSAALREQAEAHVAVARQLLDWSVETQRKLREHRWGGVVAQIVDQLIDRPVITNRWVAETYNVSAPTAKHAIDRLMEVGVLHEMTGRSYRRVFGATAVMKLVESL